MALGLGTLFACLTFGPSLLPRTQVTQGWLNTTTFAAGYGIGAAMSTIPQLSRKELEPKWYKLLCATLAGLFLLSANLGGKWHQASRELISLPPETGMWATQSVLLSVSMALVIVLLGRILGHILVKLSRAIVRRLPRLVVGLLVAVLGATVVVGPIRSALFQHLAEGINSTYSTKNSTTEEGIERPSSPQLSGSPESLISWESLGRKGRTFVATASSPKDLEAFHGAPAESPIRIYAGLESAPSIKERADLAVRDLLRTGAFQRKVIVVITTTGTGWVDNNGPVPIEYMYNGDSALVALQYSYLPSVFSFLADSHKAREAGRELYLAVYKEWLRLPKEKRPLLLSFGESLGSFGAEAAFPSAAEFKEICQGALLVGPPNVNPIRTEAVTHRDPGTPAILPIVNQGKTVRFATRAEDLDTPTATWEHPRAVYLQNASDPIVWWSPSLLFKKPIWLREKRGPDIEPAMTWFPGITFLQVSADYLEARAPAGHGHRYGTLPVDAWSKIAPPQDWTEEKTQRLKELLSEEE